MDYTVTIRSEDAVIEIAALSRQSVSMWLQARVTELEANCEAQVRNIRAREANAKLSEYAKMDTEDKAAVDAVFKAHEAKEKKKAEDVIKEGEKPIEEPAP